jgi:glutathione S-transferase
MKLIGSRTSPFVRKIRVLASEKGLACEFVEDSPSSPTSSVPGLNPLGKVPVLVTDDGECLYDSAVIAGYVDVLGAPRFVPDDPLARVMARRDEALGDGIADAGVLMFYERKRNPSRQDEASVDHQRKKVRAGIAELGRRLALAPYLGGQSLGLADIACACALLWLELRLPEFEWRKDNPTIAAWIERLESRPSFQHTRPPAA